MGLGDQGSVAGIDYRRRGAAAETAYQDFGRDRNLHVPAGGSPYFGDQFLQAAYHGAGCWRR